MYGHTHKDLAKNAVFHTRMKHIHVRDHFITILDDRVLSVERVHGSQNSVDMLIKSITIEILKLCSASVGLRA